MHVNPPKTTPKPWTLLLALLCLLLPAAALGPRPAFAHGPHDPHDLAAAGAATPSRDAAEADEDDDDDDDKKDDWDVENPPYPTFEVELDVDEGTWMSLDVSPDGSEIVFDLLGDLYTLPIDGGEARPLTSGISWDMQPRYSPDGAEIAFTSDRGGGDNLWLLKRDGSEPRAVSDEDFRLLNSPAWSPDGQFLAGRKHFTSQRSLGAGEIWLYHKSGGEGVQMVERPNDQKDLGEPAFSTDGRYLFFSQDTTPGSTFQYNKDPNTEIYTIRRLDRETGEVEDFITGPGGAVRPTPSPDGRQLAFVRRVRGKSVLFLHDLTSGRERPLWDGLERDMQETWAIHGVYPAFAWTPDSRALVLWAGGKLHRVDAGSGEVTAIPFHVRHTRRVARAVTSTRGAAPDTFPARMLRWVQVSPRGDRVVYQALGHLYLRDLPSGTPRRLTGQEDHFEYYPSWSRDGRFLTYVSWNDEELGAVRVVAVGPAGEVGPPRVLTPEPGHYTEPVFSPDGRHVVYRKGEGGNLLSPLWSHDPGIYAVAADGGGEPRRLSRDGRAPRFGAENDRVYLLTVDDDERRLEGIDLDGSDRRVHITSERATELVPSPDGRWLAFSEGFKAYITPFVATGQAVEVGPKMKSLPVAQVSRDAGNYLHWSGDSRSLHWSLGPELFTRRLEEAFSFLDGAPEELPEPAAEGLAIGFTVEAAKPDATLALVGGRVLTMKGDEILEDGAVVVRGDRVAAVGPRSAVEIPPGARVVDVTGKVVMPGLIDAHWHGSVADDDILPQQSWVDLASLAFGVTTRHDPSNTTSEIFAAAEMAAAGLILAPRTFSTGTILYGAEAPFKAEIETLDDARAHLRRMRAVGAFSVKSYNQPRRDQRQKVLAAARELDMLVMPEGGSLFQHNMTMVVDGHTGIEHSIPVPAIYDDVLRLWPPTGVAYTPTLGVAYGGLWGENYWYAKTRVWEDERLLTFVPRQRVDSAARRPVQAPEEEYNHIRAATIAAELAERGVGVQIGAHGQREGLAAHWEIWMLVQGGMTPHRALRAATLDGARYLGMEADLGSIEPGKLADLLVLDADPLADIRDSESVSLVMLGGRLYDARTMNRLAPEEASRAPLYWEEGWGGNPRPTKKGPRQGSGS